MDIHHQALKLKAVGCFLRSKPALTVHFAAFLISAFVWWVFPSTVYVESVYMVAISTYIILANLSRREILPAMAIILVAYLIRWVVSYHIYGRDLMQQIAHFGFYFLFNVTLSFCLFKYHCHPKIQQLFGVQFARSWIPQVIGICMILTINAVAILCVLVELVAYWVHPEWFSQTTPPFFYGMHQYTSAVLTCLIMLGVWSMMLDAHYLKARLDHKKNSTHF